MTRLSALLALGCLAAAAAPARADDAPNPFEYADQFHSDAIGPNRAPPTGHLRVLVVPVSFGKDPGFADFLDFFDPREDAGYTFSNFYRRQSGGLLDMDTVVADVVEFDGCPSTTVPDCAFSVQTIFEAAPIFEEVFRRLREEQGIRLGDFDRSGQDGVPDGWADGVIVLIGEWERAIAPPIYPVLEVVDQGVQVGSIAISDLDRETVLHEFGHNLGAADQYLWSHPYSLMGICDDCSLDVHSRVKLGWADVVDVPTGTELSAFMAPALDGGSVYRLGEPPEYWLVENRQPYLIGDKAVDAATGGLIVVHVDESLSPPVFGQANYPSWHPMTRVVDVPDGSKRRIFVPGDAFLPAAADHGPRSAEDRWLDSAWYDGSRSGVSVADLQPESSGCETPDSIRATLTGPNAVGSTPTRSREPSPVAVGTPCSPEQPIDETPPLASLGACQGSPDAAPWPLLLALAALFVAATRRRARA